MRRAFEHNGRKSLNSHARQRLCDPKSNSTCWLQSNGPSVGFALAGGVFLCIGNIATQYSLAFVGLSVTEVVASSITVVGGAPA